LLGKIFLSPSFVVSRIYHTVLSALGVYKSEKLKKLLDKKLRKKVSTDAISIVIFHSTVIAISYTLQSFYPVLLISLAAFVAHYPSYILAASQHNVDIGEAKTYSQLSASVSVQLPLFVRALYWNMNFHSEHHLAPSVPHYNLSRLQSALIQSKNGSQNINITSLISEINGNYVKN